MLVYIMYDMRAPERINENILRSVYLLLVVL